MKSMITHYRPAKLAIKWAAMALAVAFGFNSVRAQITPVGDIARDFTIINHKTGQPLRLYDYQGNIILLDFWAYWCGPCQQAAADMEPNIVQYYRTNGGNRYGVPVQVISISVDPSSPSQVNSFIQTYGLELVGDDNTGLAYNQFGSGAIPHLVVINGTTNSSNCQAWQVLYSTAGYDRNAIKAQIDSVQTTLPVCALTEPAGGAVIPPPDVTLAAAVTSNGKIIKQVEFYNGATLIGAATNPPYTITWSTYSPGEKTVFARARYGTSSLADSTPVTFSVGTAPPSIALQPANRSAGPGWSTTFTIVARGSDPLSYQWRKNSTNLCDGGHCSGTTTPTLVITNCDVNDAGNYSCAVTNAYGSTNSSSATLTMTTCTPVTGVLNWDSEGGFALAGGGYVANNWTEWEASPDVVIGYDESVIVHGGAHSQRIRVWGGTNGTSGGVYQRVPVTVGQPCSVSVWVYAGDALTACSLGVDPAGGVPQGGTPGGVTWSPPTTNVNWVQKTLTEIATADWITVYYKVASPDNVKRNGYFDDATPAESGGPLQLFARRSGNTLTMMWPECPGARLEQADSLSGPGTWATATNQVSHVGGQRTVTLTPFPQSSAGFFRLVLE